MTAFCQNYVLYGVDPFVGINNLRNSIQFDIALFYTIVEYRLRVSANTRCLVTSELLRCMLWLYSSCTVGSFFFYFTYKNVSFD